MSQTITLTGADTAIVTVGGQHTHFSKGQTMTISDGDWAAFSAGQKAVFSAGAGVHDVGQDFSGREIFSGQTLSAPEVAVDPADAAALTSAQAGALTSSQNATTAASDPTTTQALSNALKASYNALQTDVAALRTAHNAAQVDIAALRTKLNATLDALRAAGMIA